MTSRALALSAFVVAVLAAASLKSAVTVAGSGSVVGKVKLVGSDGEILRDVSRVVVILENVPNSDPKRLRMTRAAKIVQRDRRFTPDLAVITVGSAVEFPNQDFIDHNVFSLSRARVFDLGLYRNPESKSVTFHHAGVVDVYCNIHPDMAAKIKIVDTVYYARAKEDGSFDIPNVPAGTYPVVAWQPYGDEVRSQVTIEDGKTAKLELSLREGPHDRAHLNKEGKPYGRYH